MRRRYPACTPASSITAKECAMIQLGYKLCSEEHGKLAARRAKRKAA
jgi:hypothetical protein